jgi:glycosyltransferase involved in cell wall biosynthesis
VQVVRAIGVLEPGGAQLSALRLSRALRAHGVETVLLAGDATPAGLDLARAHGFEVEHFAEVRGLQWEPCDAFADWLADRLAGADLVHGHMFGAWWAAARAAPARVPVVASEHNALTWPRAPHDDDAAAVAGRLGCFFGHGPESRAWAARIGVPGDRIVAGESAVEGLDGRPNADLPSPRITYAGRFAAEKGPDVLVEALERLRELVPELAVLLTGPARGYVRRRLEQLGIPHRHVLARSRTELARAYHALDVYLVASRQEGGPKGVLEAMATGVPLVSTRVGQATDLVQDGRNGWLVEVEDAEALAERAAEVGGGDGAVQTAGRATAEAYARERLDGAWDQLLEGFVMRPETRGER